MRFAVNAGLVVLAACAAHIGPVPQFMLGGRIEGLEGELILRNGDEALPVASEGNFVFREFLHSGEPYEVEVFVAPEGQRCDVARGSGVVAGANVTDVVVTCAARSSYTIGGIVEGLTGTVVLSNAGMALAVSTNGEFAFPRPASDGDRFSVAVLVEPHGQSCSVVDASGTVSGASVTGVRVECADLPSAAEYAIGGAVTGLSGRLVLANGGATLLVRRDGAFKFAERVIDGTDYGVHVLIHPAGQSCRVDGGVGTIAGAEVDSIVVTCSGAPAARYAVGGLVGGLAGRLVLGNRGDLTVVEADGDFAFSGLLANGEDYAVEVLLQPYGELCTVRNALGTIDGHDVIDVGVDCGPAPATTHSIGGSATGLAGRAVLINRGRTLPIDSSGPFVFEQLLPNGTDYDVGVLLHPSGQLCTVYRGIGTVAGSDVTNIAVLCGALPTVATYTVGGEVQGLDGQLILYNLTEAIVLTDDGPFQFPSGLPDSSIYAVRIGMQPDGLLCTVENGSGTLSLANVWNVSVHCASDDTTLADLSVSDGTLSPSVDPSASTYALHLDYLSPVVRVTATPSDPLATLTIDDIPVTPAAQSFPIAIPAGRSEITIGITAPSGSTRVTRIITDRGAQPYLKPSNTGSADAFGTSMAMSGDTLVIGAPLEDSTATGVDANPWDNSASASGAVYVFIRSDDGWTQQAYLKASNTDAGDRFGYSVAISGDTLVVGAPEEDSNATGVGNNEADNTANSSGAAYVFTRNGGTWAQQAYLKASNTGATDRFGEAVAVAGDTIAVGAKQEDSNLTGVNPGGADNDGANNSGAVYVFGRSGAIWSQEGYIKTSVLRVGARFGQTLAMSGETLAVGAPEMAYGAARAGGAYVFTRSGGTWREEALLTASNVDAEDRFGSCIAISGDTILVGTPLEDSPARGIDGVQTNSATGTGSGAVYVFTRAAGLWSQEAYIKASNSEAADAFGTSVSIDGDTAVIGAPREDSGAIGVAGNQADNARSDSGAVYLFTRAAGVWTQSAYIKASYMADGDNFGATLACVGDTITVASPAEDSAALGVDGEPANDSAFNSGAAYVFR